MHALRQTLRTLGLYDGTALTMRAVSPGFFDAAGIHPMLGGFTADDWHWYDSLNAHLGDLRQPVLISFRLWRELRYSARSFRRGESAAWTPCRHFAPMTRHQS
jgi:hypothetical protein